jgi:hypothetical protein
VKRLLLLLSLWLLLLLSVSPGLLYCPLQLLVVLLLLLVLPLLWQLTGAANTCSC